MNFIFIENQETLAEFEQEENCTSICHQWSFRKIMLVSILQTKGEAIAIVQPRNDGDSNECNGSMDEEKKKQMSVTLKK